MACVLLRQLCVARELWFAIPPAFQEIVKTNLIAWCGCFGTCFRCGNRLEDAVAVVLQPASGSIPASPPSCMLGHCASLLQHSRGRELRVVVGKSHFAVVFRSHPGPGSVSPAHRVLSAVQSVGILTR
jgi:hypothetical protein